MPKVHNWAINYLLPVVLFAGAQHKGRIWMQYTILAQVIFTIFVLQITNKHPTTKETAPWQRSHNR